MSAIVAFDVAKSRYERGAELEAPPRVKPLRRLAATVTRRTLITAMVDICQTALLQATEAAYEAVYKHCCHQPPHLLVSYVDAYPC